MLWMITVGTVLFLLFILFFTKIRISLGYQGGHTSEGLTIKVYAWGFRCYKLEVPGIAMDEGEATSLHFKQKKQIAGMDAQRSDKEITTEEMLEKMKHVHHLLKRVSGVHRILRRFLAHMTVHKLQWHTRLGLEDAASTGMAAGGAWMIKGNIAGLLAGYMYMVDPPDYSVIPEYDREVFQTELSCMFTFRSGHAIGAVWQFVKFWKGRQPIWANKNIPSRDS